MQGEKSVTAAATLQRVGRQPVADGAVADLVVVLRADHEAPRIVTPSLQVSCERPDRPVALRNSPPARR